MTGMSCRRSAPLGSRAGVSCAAAGWLAATALMSVLSVAAAARAGEFTRTLSLDSAELKLVNMIGEVRLEAGGDRYEITVAVRGKDADESLVEIMERSGRDGRVLIKFPIDQHREYVYPAMGRGSKTTFTYQSRSKGSWLEEIIGSLGSKRITVAGKGDGLEIWADVTIRVPAGRSTDVLHKVGAIRASGITGDLVLDTASGSVTVEKCDGDVLADTGSGVVEAFGLRGNFKADTGSGAVLIEDFVGDELVADTGSGRVELAGIKCRDLYVDTGSGSVEAERVEADQAKIDTGSGSVKLQLDRMGDGRFVLDTGSGSVELVLPRNASAQVIADTGSGSVRVDVDDASYHRKERDEVEFRLGGGDARVLIDTGSGSIRIAQR